MMKQSDSELAKRIEELWGESLKRIAFERPLANIPLSRTCTFLGRVGLPRRNSPLEMTFYDGEDLLTDLVVHGTRYWIIGDDYGTKISVDANEQVWSVSEGSLPLRFVNTSLAQFVLFLGIYRYRPPALTPVTDEQAAGILTELRHEFGEADPLALADIENWWSVILEQIEQGLA